MTTQIFSYGLERSRNNTPAQCLLLQDAIKYLHKKSFTDANHNTIWGLLD